MKVSEDNLEKSWLYTFYLHGGMTETYAIDGYKKSEAREYLVTFKNNGFLKSLENGSVKAVPAASIHYIIMSEVH